LERSMTYGLFLGNSVKSLPRETDYHDSEAGQSYVTVITNTSTKRGETFRYKSARCTSAGQPE
jgi:hypothetical protein